MSLNNLAADTCPSGEKALSYQGLPELGHAVLLGIFEATPECIKIVSRDGTLLQMNPAGLAMVEALPDARLEGASIFDIIAPESLMHWTAMHERVCDGERLNWEFDIVGLAGTHRHMETHAVPLRMPNGSNAQLAITRDVTKRRKDDEKIRENEHHFKQLLQALPAAVYTTDTQGHITFFNDAAVDLAGRRPTLGDKWCVTWKLLLPDGTRLPHEECPMAVALHEERPVRDQEAIAVRPDGSQVWFQPYPTPLTDSSGAMTGAINMLVDITHRKEAEQRQKLLIDELNHRVKNTLATVQSLMVQTAHSATTVEEYRRAVEARVIALSHAHDQLSQRNWSDVDLKDLAFATLQPYRSDGNIEVTGQSIILPSRSALMFSLAFHELATNAAKYGALSQMSGKVHLAWSVKVDGNGSVLAMTWRESGGPRVEPRQRQGFGSRLVERGISAELNGTAAMEFNPSGLQCTIEVPLENVA